MEALTTGISCMGGWGCKERDHCAYYHAEDRRNPVERLCPPGRDGDGPTTPRAPLAQPVEWPALNLPKT